jgi:hypothetical protein
MRDDAVLVSGSCAVAVLAAAVRVMLLSPSLRLGPALADLTHGYVTMGGSTTGAHVAESRSRLA